MAKPNLLRIIGIAAFLPLVLLGVQVHADTTCYAPAPVDCATLSTTECSQQNSEYQSEAAIYNSCIAANYSADAQSSANQIRIQSYCDSSGDVQSCTAEYDACQATAPTNSFGQPAGSGTCTYSCDSGYYMSISNTCVAEGTQTAAPTPAPVVTPTPVSAPAVTAPTPTVTTVTTATVLAPPSVVQTAAPTVATKPKSLFSQVIQAVTPKPVSVVTASTTVAATATVTVQPTPPVTQKPAPTFWQKVGSFFAKLNPLTWF